MMSTLKIDSAGETRTQTRSVAYLHPDTRERGGWDEGKGPIFGMWDWNGGHVTMTRTRPAQSPRRSAAWNRRCRISPHLPDEDKKYLESIGAKSFFLGYQLVDGPHTLGGLAVGSDKAGGNASGFHQMAERAAEHQAVGHQPAGTVAVLRRADHRADFLHESAGILRRPGICDDGRRKSELQAAARFPGAVDDKTGKLQKADGGTLFLDEVGDMSLKTQAKVLRALEEQRLEPVGAAESIQVDVRVVASTNKNLEEEIERGNFREDLFYRLNVVPFHVPPLRERMEDVPLLADHFLTGVHHGLWTQAEGIDRGRVASRSATIRGLAMCASYGT